MDGEDESEWFSPPVTTSNLPGGIVFKPDRMGDEEMGDAQANGNVRQQLFGTQLTVPVPQKFPGHFSRAAQKRLGLMANSMGEPHARPTRHHLRACFQHTGAAGTLLGDSQALH